MLEAFDPASTLAAKPLMMAMNLSDEAIELLEPGDNLRRYLERLVAQGLPGDALVVIARSLPVQYLVAWCCECVRAVLQGTEPWVEAERAAVALAEQCLNDPTDERRRLCLEFAERGSYATAGAWLVTSAAWADGNLAPPGAPRVDAPARAVGEAVVAALKMAAARSTGDRLAQMTAFATRALAVFGTP